MTTKQVPVISFQNISKDYITGTQTYQALKDISFDIYKNEFVAIMGPSGSGKSTTMHIMGALDNATDGQYFLKGKDITEYDEDALAEIRNREIGFIFQSFNLLPRTSVLKNVERPMMYADIPPDQRKDKALRSLKLVGLEEKAENLSNHISGGQIQRVAIARALVMNPSIILADEPTGNLDSKTAHTIMDFFQELNRQGNTIVLITHEDDIAAYAKRVIRLHDGTIKSDTINSDKTHANR
ncbi:MAG: ABC transporter ATP-binding protein [Candidatus Roizmanbacteria bacterium]|nr:ABC transporter ATP-binding protein [Candidatus Roizmanbacteria bacterium]